MTKKVLNGTRRSPISSLMRKSRLLSRPTFIEIKSVTKQIGCAAINLLKDLTIRYNGTSQKQVLTPLIQQKISQTGSTSL